MELKSCWHGMTTARRCSNASAKLPPSRPTPSRVTRPCRVRGKKTNHLDAKTRELIALAVAVTTRCDGCITVHTAEALKHGASKEEISEALGVAVALNAGAALVYSARVMDAVEAVQLGT